MTEPLAGDGLPLSVEVIGDGPAIVFSAGYCQTGENFLGQVAPLLETGFRVIRWDYRGHGRSGVPEAPEAYSMAQVIDDLGRVLDRYAPGQRVVLVGLSFGGLLSLHFCLGFPQRVQGLVLVASGPGFKSADAQARWQAQVGRVADRLEERGFAGYTDGPASETAIGRRQTLATAQAAGRAILSQDPLAVAEFGRCVVAPALGVIDELPLIETPTLIVVGADDEAFLRAGEVMAARIPKATHIVIPSAGHVVNIEQADVFNRVLLDFLRNLG